MGLDSVPLTRTGGLDVAQTIAEEMPNTGVFLLGALDKAAISKGGWLGSGGVSFCRESLGNCVPTPLADLRKEAVPGHVIFARIEPKPEEENGQKTSSFRCQRLKLLACNCCYLSLPGVKCSGAI
jgi:hypothetical protein